MNIKFNLTQLHQNINNRKVAIKKKREVLQNIARSEQRAVKRRIQTTKLDPNGRRWRPWRDSTLRSRQRKGNTGRGLLNDTGNLLKSIYYSIRGNVVTIGTRLRYARFVQEGTRRMAAREFLGWSTQSLNNARKQLKRLFGE